MNPLLRDHVTRTGFDLSLTRGQIEALVWLNESIGKGGPRDWSTYPSGRWASHVGGLHRRGLTWHHYDQERWRKATMAERDAAPVSDFYGITEAGQLVVGLLRETGLYEEAERALFPDRFTRTGKRRKLKVA